MENSTFMWMLFSWNKQKEKEEMYFVLKQMFYLTGNKKLSFWDSFRNAFGNESPGLQDKHNRISLGLAFTLDQFPALQ